VVNVYDFVEAADDAFFCYFSEEDKGDVVFFALIVGSRFV